MVVYKVDTSDTDDDYYPVYTGDSSVTYKVIADAAYAYVRVMTPWTKAWQAQRKVTATVVASELIGVAAADLDDTALAWGDTGSLSVSTANTDVSTSGQVTFAWENYGIHTHGVPDAGALWVRIELCEITSECFFDWKTHGPFRTGTFSMTNTRIPELKDTWMLFDFDASDQTYLYARIEPSTHWQFGTLYYSIGGVSFLNADAGCAGGPCCAPHKWSTCYSHVLLRLVVLVPTLTPHLRLPATRPRRRPAMARRQDFQSWSLVQLERMGHGLARLMSPRRRAPS